MEIKVKTGEKIRLNYGDCPRCERSFNTKAKKKTFHHALPKFLNPKTEIEVSLCKECHDDLNGYYVHQAAKLGGGNASAVVGKNQPKNFEEFLNNYKLLRNDFMKKTKGKAKTPNGEFGEGLWLNLVNFLESLSEKVEAKTK